MANTNDEPLDQANAIDPPEGQGGGTKAAAVNAAGTPIQPPSPIDPPEGQGGGTAS